MRRLIIIFAALPLVLALGVPAATAQSIPPDNSGADQYTEGVPGPEGNKPSKRPGSGGSGGSGGSSGSGGSGESSGSGGSTGSGPIPPGTLAAIAAAGDDGALAAAVLSGTAPDSSALRKATRGNAAGGERGAALGAEDAAREDDDSLVERAGLGRTLGTAAAGSDGGMGVALPILLGAVLLGGVGLALRRRLRAGPAA